MPRLAVIALAAALLGGCSRTSSQADDAAIDAAIDGIANPCQACSAAQLCVASFDGACLRQVECVARTTDCPNNTCSAACESAYCSRPYQCQERPACGGEPVGAFTCYGP